MSEWTCASCEGANPEGMSFCGHCGAAASTQERAPAAEDALRSFVTASVADRIVEEGGQFEEERRLITAVFADVSGFTPLADRLDPEELLEVIDPVVTALSSVVGRYEGFVEKFAGDALLALFGAPISHEDDADRALLVALEMHRELARIRETLPVDASGLTLHVGVNTGHGIARLIGSSVRTDYGVLGDSVVLAQRLEAAAAPGETYVSDSTYRLTAERFAFELAGELTLKGKAEPVRAWRLIGERPRAERRRQAVFGRERELARLEQALERAAAGESAALVIIGEPGVGKSTLMEAARESAAGQGLRWVSARCLSYGAGLPYWPLADLLRREAGIEADTSTEIASARLGEMLDAASEDVAVVAQFLGIDTTQHLDLEPEAFQRRLHRAFLGWLGSLAEAGGLVLAVEDLHWVDSSTLEVLGHVARAGEGAILLLVAARPEARELLEPLRPEELPLGPLDVQAVTEVIQATLEGPAPRLLVDFVVRRADGNPFFAEELVRALSDRSAIVREGERWKMRQGWDARELPTTVEEVLAARIDLLPHRAAEVLQAASVVGRRVRKTLLREVAGADAERELDRLVASGFLDRSGQGEDESLEFHHALVQDVAYARLLRRRRRELHARVASAAERLYGAGDDTVDLLARHLYLAGAPNAGEYVVRAGRRAARLYANHEALLHLGRALELSPDDHELQLELAILHELVGEYDRALDLFTAVRDATGEVQAWRGVAAVLRKRGDYERALSAVDAAFSDERLSASDVTPLWLEQAWTLSVSGRLAGAVDVARAGLAAADGSRTHAVGELLTQLARAESIEGNIGAAIEDGRRAYDLFLDLGDLRGRALAARVLGDVYRLARRFDDATASLQEGLTLAERVGSAEEVGGCLINLGMMQLERGDAAAAIALNQRAIEEFERLDHGSGRAWGYSNLAWAHANAREFDEASRHADHSLAFSQEIGHTITIAETLDTIAYIALETGDTTRAAAAAEEAARVFLEMGMHPKAGEALQRAAEAWKRQGDEERAHETLTRAQSLAVA
jgi:adenylate cyclase